MPANLSLKLTRLSPRLNLGGWAESGAGQREVLGKAAAQLSSTVMPPQKNREKA
jgi:hypothetical protein